METRDIRTRGDQSWRSQEFFDREVRELYDLRDPHSFTTAIKLEHRENCLLLVLPTPICPQFWCPWIGGCPEVDREDFRKLCNAERADGHCETLQEPMRLRSICFVGLTPYPLVRLVQLFGQFFEHLPYARWNAVSECFQLAVYPEKPGWTNKYDDL